MKKLEYKITPADLACWHHLTEQNAHNEVRLAICDKLTNECKRQGSHDLFKNERAVYQRIKDECDRDGYLSFENDCMRIGCDEKMLAMVGFDDRAAMMVIKDCL